MYLELAHRNDWTYSEQLDNVAWAKNNSSITANSVAAPNGTTTADTLVEASDTSQAHNILRTLTGATDNTQQAFGGFGKAKERGELFAFGLNKAGSFLGARYNLSTGVVSEITAGVTASMVDCENGWWRLLFAFDVGSGGTTPSFQIRLHNGTSHVYNGDGTSGAYLWGLQWAKDAEEVGGYASTEATAFTTGIGSAPLLEGSTLTWDAAVKMSRAELAWNADASTFTIAHGKDIILDDRGTTKFVGLVVNYEFSKNGQAPGSMLVRATCLDYVHRMATTEVGDAGIGAAYRAQSDRAILQDILLDSSLDTYITSTDANVDIVLSSIDHAFPADTLVRDAFDFIAQRAGAEWSLDPNIAPATKVALHYNTEANAGDADWDVSDSPNGTTTFDVENLRAQSVFDQPGNDIIVVGGVDVFGRRIKSETTDATSISTYGTKRLRFSSDLITTQDYADDVAAALLAKHKDPYWVASFGTKKDGLAVNELIDVTNADYGLSAETLFIRRIQARQFVGGAGEAKTQYTVELGPEHSGPDRLLRQLSSLGTGLNVTPLLLRGVDVSGNEGFAKHQDSASTDESIYQDASGGLSISGWIRRGSNITGDDRTFVTATNSSFAASDGYFTGITASEAITLRSGGETWTAGTIPDDGQWHHVCISWDGGYTGTSVAIYIDGVSQSVSNSGSGSWSLNSASDLAVFGPINDWAFSQVAVWSRELKDGDIQRLAARPDASIPPTIHTANRIAYWALDDFADGVTITNDSAQLQDQWNGFDLDTDVTVSGSYGAGIESLWNPLL